MFIDSLTFAGLATFIGFVVLVLTLQHLDLCPDDCDDDD